MWRERLYDQQAIWWISWWFPGVAGLTHARMSLCATREVLVPALFAKVFGNKIPIDQIPKCCQILRSGISVVDIVSMLPDIAG